MVFGLVLLCLLGMGVAALLIYVTPPEGGGEWRGVNQFPFALGFMAFGGWGSGLSLVGFCLGLLGIFKSPRNARTAAITGMFLNGLVLLPAACLFLWLFIKHY